MRALLLSAALLLPAASWTAEPSPGREAYTALLNEEHGRARELAWAARSREDALVDLTMGRLFLAGQSVDMDV